LLLVEKGQREGEKLSITSPSPFILSHQGRGNVGTALVAVRIGGRAP